MRLSLISVRIPLPIPKKNATRFLNGYTKATRPQAASNWSLSVMASLVLCRLCSLKCTLFFTFTACSHNFDFFVLPIYVVSGFIKFLGPYYMLVITERREICEICGDRVHEVSKSEIISLRNPSVLSNIANSRDENKYKKLLCMVDLTKDFFFSYYFNIMRSFQKNICNHESGATLCKKMFVWNEFLTWGIRHLRNTVWTVALVYAFFKQVRIRYIFCSSLSKRKTFSRIPFFLVTAVVLLFVHHFLWDHYIASLYHVLSCTKRSAKEVLLIFYSYTTRKQRHTEGKNRRHVVGVTLFRRHTDETSPRK
ncbi:uncharacterized protein LOC111205173 [Brassica napus]|uniref:uncharacterized protein LOC111205173 n=1 Tax=Brassica napus TaxID=3708 RepID=UPI00207A097B|nr:uncharacterized protein LOC111205173 [Brassica napus]